MHELAFADAARPTRVVCLRLLLQPYTIGHEILLLRQRNPFVVSSASEFDALPVEQQIFALKTAALICEKTWSQNQKPEKWLRLWGWLTRKANWPLEIAEFRNYLAEAHASLPSPTEIADDICAKAAGYEPMRENRGRSFGAPYLAQLLNFISTLDVGRWTFGNCIYDFPYALGSNLYISHLEMLGSCRIENAVEHEERLNWDKIVAAEAAHEAASTQSSSSTSKPSGLATEPPDFSDQSSIVNPKSSMGQGGDSA